MELKAGYLMTRRDRDSEFSEFEDWLYGIVKPLGVHRVL